MHIRENIQSGFWFSLGFGVAIVVLTTGCFYLAEAGLNLLNPKQEKGETQVSKENVRTGHEEDEPNKAPHGVEEVDLMGQPRSDIELAVAMTTIDNVIVKDALKVPPELMVQLPTIRDALKELISARKGLPCVGSSDFKVNMFALRAQVEETKVQTMLVFKEHPIFSDKFPQCPPESSPADVGEMKANLKLAFRHLEDARMRFGKTIQAFDGGKSCYPR